MESANEDTTTEARLSRSAFTCSAIAADDDLAGQEKPLWIAHGDLKKAQRDAEDLAEEVQKRRAVLVVRDRRCDAVIEDFELRLLALVKKDREDPRYGRYFKLGLRAVTQADMRDEEPELCADMITLMSEDAAHATLGPLVNDVHPKLVAALDAVVAIDADLSATEKLLQKLEGATLPALEAAWDDAYTKLHGSIEATLGKDSGRIESYFKPFRKPRKKAKKAEPKPAVISPGGTGQTTGGKSG